MLIFRVLTLVILQGQTIAPFPEECRSISSAFLPNFIDGGEIPLTSILMGVIFSILLIILEIRRRNHNLKYDLETLPFPLFVAKILAIILIINAFIYTLAMYAGIPYILYILILLIF